jgi:hypothetical protein
MERGRRQEAVEQGDGVVKDAEDVLIIEGFPVYEPRDGGLTVDALSVTTKKQLAAQRQGQRVVVGIGRAVATRAYADPHVVGVLAVPVSGQAVSHAILAARYLTSRMESSVFLAHRSRTELHQRNAYDRHLGHCHE